MNTHQIVQKTSVLLTIFIILVVYNYRELGGVYFALGVGVVVTYMGDCILTFLVMRNQIRVQNLYFRLQKENNIYLSQTAKFIVISSISYTLLNEGTLFNKTSILASIYIGVVYHFLVDVVYLIRARS